MYESIQGYHSGSSSTRKGPLDPSSSRPSVGDTGGSLLTEQTMLDHVSAMEVRMMASYEEAKRANAIEAAATSKTSEMESVSEGGSGTTIVLKQSSEAAAGLFPSSKMSSGSPQSPRGGKWVDVPQCPAVESCFALNKLPLASAPSLDQSTKTSEKTDLGSMERGEKSKHGQDKDSDHFLRPSSAPPGWSKKSAVQKRERKARTPRPDPFWNEQVDWTPGLAFKCTLPQTDLIEVPQ